MANGGHHFERKLPSIKTSHTISNCTGFYFQSRDPKGPKIANLCHLDEPIV